PHGKSPGPPEGNPSEIRAFLPARDTGFEPVAFGSGGRSEGSPDLPSASQPVGFLPGAAPAPVQAFQPFAGIPKPFVPAVSPGAARATGRLRALEGGAGRLLTVREAAER